VKTRKYIFDSAASESFICRILTRKAPVQSSELYVAFVVDKVTLTQLLVWVPNTVGCCQLLLYQWTIFIYLSNNNAQWAPY